MAGQPGLPAGLLSGHGRSGRQARAVSPPSGTLAVLLIQASVAPPAPVACPGRRLDSPPGAERWWGRPHVQAPPADAHRSRYRPRHPGGRAGPGTPDALLTIEEVIAELRVSRAAFYRWRRRGTGPAEVRLPGGGVRIRRSALQAWLCRREQPQQEDTPE